jgi:hypothetical protein
MSVARIYEPTVKAGADELRGRLESCLRQRSPRRAGLAAVLRHIGEEDWGAYLFGGFPRDLAVFGASAEPRDIDIVVERATADDIERSLGAFVRRHTRFGGFALHLYGWDVDIWPVRDTWAFRSLWNRAGSIEELPQTTFLNAEAVLVEVRNPHKKERRVIEQGFFDGIRKRELELNLPANPYPELCVVRALFLALKLDFTLGPRLVKFIVDRADALDAQTLETVQVKHYGAVRETTQALHAWIHAIQAHHGAQPGQPYDFPAVAGRQLHLWDTVDPDVRGLY